MAYMQLEMMQNDENLFDDTKEEYKNILEDDKTQGYGVAQMIGSGLFDSAFFDEFVVEMIRINQNLAEVSSPEGDIYG